MLENYPKSVLLKDGTPVVLRPMVTADGDRLWEFFRRVPEEDRQFLKDDVAKREVIEGWARGINYDRILPILCDTGARIIGDATLHRRHYGWSTHVGEIRLVVDRDYRRRGMGTLLARELFFIALKVGLGKLISQIMVDQVVALRIFEKLGFEREAVLRNHVQDLKGKRHNLVIMANDVATLWRRLEETVSGRDFSGG